MNQRIIYPTDEGGVARYTSAFTPPSGPFPTQ